MAHEVAEPETKTYEIPVHIETSHVSQSLAVDELKAFLDRHKIKYTLGEIREVE